MTRLGKAEGVMSSMAKVCHAYDKNLTVKIRTAHYGQNHVYDKVGRSGELKYRRWGSNPGSLRLLPVL